MQRFKEINSNYLISAIVPTIGRPDALTQLLETLVNQTTQVAEVIVADASDTEETAQVIAQTRWANSGLTIHRVNVSPPNAVRQRQAAINVARGEFLLLLDDDVMLESDCVEQLLALLRTHPDVVAVTSDFSNEFGTNETTLWRFYLRYILRLKQGDWQGRVIGPLLRFWYYPAPSTPQPMEWLGAGNSMIRRSAFERAGGFSNFFLRRCTTNEDVDLGLRLTKHGRILLCPAARLAHHHAPGGRVTISVAAEDDLYNRFLILHRTMEKTKLRALRLTLMFYTVETASNFFTLLRRGDYNMFTKRLYGRTLALCRILYTALWEH